MRIKALNIKKLLLNGARQKEIKKTRAKQYGWRNTKKSKWVQQPTKIAIDYIYIYNIIQNYIILYTQSRAPKTSKVLICYFHKIVCGVFLFFASFFSQYVRTSNGVYVNAFVAKFLLFIFHYLYVFVPLTLFNRTSKIKWRTKKQWQVKWMSPYDTI